MTKAAEGYARDDDQPSTAISHQPLPCLDSAAGATSSSCISARAAAVSFLKTEDEENINNNEKVYQNEKQGLAPLVNGSAIALMPSSARRLLGGDTGGTAFIGGGGASDDENDEPSEAAAAGRAGASASGAPDSNGDDQNGGRAADPDPTSGGSGENRFACPVSECMSAPS